MSWFSSKSNETPAQNFFPITSYSSGFGELSDTDTAWACTSNRGFQTETQIWYSILEDGSVLMVQIIWSYLGLFVIPATNQMTFKLYNPKTKKSVWKSINASGFKPNGRSSKSDQYEIKHTGTSKTEEKYDITASLDKHVQLSITVTKPASAPGFKFGQGKDGGISTFGQDREDGKRDGFVVHRFHPLAKSAGSIIVDGAVVDAKGEAMFVNAIQGMRPDSLASRWNFAFFTTGGGHPDGELGTVRALQMEFETTDGYGPKGAKSGRTKCSVGAVYSTALSTNPIIVVGQTKHADPSAFPTTSTDVCSATHFGAAHDKDTGYMAPSAVEFQWEGDRRDGQGRLSAKVRTEEGSGATVGKGGLMEKVDVLAEIPYVIRKGLAAVTGTKPYIYQNLSDTTLEVTTGDKVVPVKGWMFSEASFISE
ncbi:oxidative stress survival, Svf1-like protein [Naematelia encephala]|uniref:Oxidative stress survival, Svf1-like protein n=1 Tax=Naematelia encephala TaxID=71784 RepID=A0A1Y2BE76_9TREE|nr:oxidative stress survival, Svf1-like protein [Naematelia encephala]